MHTADMNASLVNAIKYALAHRKYSRPLKSILVVA